MNRDIALRNCAVRIGLSYRQCPARSSALAEEFPLCLNKIVDAGSPRTPATCVLLRHHCPSLPGA